MRVVHNAIHSDSRELLPEISVVFLVWAQRFTSTATSEVMLPRMGTLHREMCLNLLLTVPVRLYCRKTVYDPKIYSDQQMITWTRDVGASVYKDVVNGNINICLLYTSPSPRDRG